MDSFVHVNEEDVVVEAAGVAKSYGAITALDHVDLNVRRGSIHAVIGPNGAGKTTLLSSLFGLVIPDSGTLRLFGRTRPEAEAEARSSWLDGVGGFVESPRFYPYLSGRRNLEVLAALDGGAASQLIGELLDVVGLGRAANDKVRGYSLGMRQRLGLAAALLREPDLLILDEPTNGLDPAGTRDLLFSIRHLAREGLTVLLSSHNIVHVEQVCDSVTILHRGTVRFDGTLEHLRSDAPRPSWRLHTNDDSRALALAETMEDVESARRNEGGLTILASQDRLDDLVLRLAASTIAVRGLAVDRTPLESIFFALTHSGSADTSELPLASATELDSDFLPQTGRWGRWRGAGSDAHR